MTIRVVDDGYRGYRLLSPKGEIVGWVRGLVVGVNGFPDEDAAIEAALRSYRVLVAWLGRHGLEPLPQIGDGAIRVAHDATRRWILCDDIPVARLPGAAAEHQGTLPQHSFEIVLRGAVNDGMGIHAALIALRAAQGRISVADVVGASLSRGRGGVVSMLTPTTYAYSAEG